jgi:hypothetical protein
LVQRLKAVVDFYLFANVHMALCGVAMVLVTQSFFGFTLRSELLVFVFCGTFFLYNLQRLPSAFEKNIERKFIRHRWNTENRIVLSGTVLLAAVAAGWSFFQLYPRSQVIALLPAALSLAYAFPFIPAKPKWKRLREIPGIKIFIVAFVWAIIIALLPAAAADITTEDWLTPAVITWTVSMLLMFFALTVPFDIRDLHYDGKRLKTIPAVIGVKRSIVLSLATLALSVGGVLTLFFVFHTGTLTHVVVYIAWSILTGILIARSKPTLHEYYYSLVLDGLLIVLWGMVWGAKVLGLSS